MRIIGLIGFIFLLTACTETVVEEISMEDLIPQSEYDKQQANNDNVIEAVISESSLNYIDSVIQLKFPFVESNSNENRKSEFVDRLNFEDKEESIWLLDSVSINITAWTYVDSIQTENAFFNWIDCWGEDCKSFRVGESVKLQNDAVSIWVGEHNIVYINSPENYDFNQLQKIVFELYGEDWKYIFNKKQKRRINWLMSPIEY